MADGHHIGKCWKWYNSPTNWPISTKLWWSHAITSLTCPPWRGCHGNGRCLATAHWTVISYGRLEAESVNQFWRNLYTTTNLESNDSHLIKYYDNFLKIQDGFWGALFVLCCALCTAMHNFHITLYVPQNCVLIVTTHSGAEWGC